jgi:hypothetical protein
MSYLEPNERTYVKPAEVFGAKQRPFLGIQNSAVVVCDDGVLRGFAGDEANVNLVSVVTKKDGLDQVNTIPTDFRMIGISILTAAGIPEATQIAMFSNFMTNFTKEQRDTYVSMYDGIDQNDTAALEAFVTQMLAMLS